MSGIQGEILAIEIEYFSCLGSKKIIDESQDEKRRPDQRSASRYLRSAKVQCRAKVDWELWAKLDRDSVSLELAQVRASPLLALVLQAPVLREPVLRELEPASLVQLALQAQEQASLAALVLYGWA